MQIRKCKTEEVAAVGAFYDTVVEYLDSHTNYPKWQYKIYPSEEYVRAMTAEGFQYICKEDGKTVAAFVLNRDPEGDYQKGKWSVDLQDGEFMVIHALAVDPKFHKTGLGKKIIEFCIDTARRSGCKAIRLDIVPDNIPAKHLYESVGFTYVGDEDVRPEVEHIPKFSMYEMNLED
ncbi:MAG: GNAT family N-acetyltransferase [Lachnospiraceae bacterium]|nr:GNAT family N-acetyltransferase [Lachnospiraceae bacterium]